MFTQPIFGDLMFIFPAIGAAILVYSGVLKEKEAKAVLSNDLIFMLAGVFVLSNAIGTAVQAFLSAISSLKPLEAIPAD